jgi:hypothetical protein
VIVFVRRFSTAVLFVPLVVVLLAAAACGDVDDGAAGAASTDAARPAATGLAATAPTQTETAVATKRAALSPEARAYLEAVEQLVEPLFGSDDTFDAALRQTWSSRERLVEVLLEHDRTSLLEAVLADARNLAPHPDYIDDHALLIGNIADAIPRVTADRQATEEGDLVRAALGTSELILGQLALRATVSISFCEAITADGSPLEARCSANGGPSPEGEFVAYGSLLFDAWGRYARAFLSRAPLFGAYQALSQEERFELVGLLQPAIVEAMDLAIHELEALTPPEAMVPDHARLLQYLDENRSIALAINTAVNDGDTATVLRLFNQSGEIFLNASEDLSPAVGPLVGLFFPVSITAIAPIGD